RTLLRDAPVVVLDEPTTGLDSDTAQRLIEPLRALLAGRTAVLITHDPQLLRVADRVIRLDPVQAAAAC
ncbi:MAG: ABC transporter ATP-binding protein, partial [Actinomycetota bacterium]|nr:ABC transporter ATP-binding protein [Actinomycetota bacterium]